jgi:glycosyltransferase involved in cell wall biosynthesis
MNPTVYLVGARWRHHARHSGYEHFGRYIGRRIRPVTLPLGSRRAARAEARATTIWAGIHMLARRDAIFHALDGDRDLPDLVRFSDHTENRLIATVHWPSERMGARLLRAMERLHAAILVSNSQTAPLAQVLPDERLFVVPHGVDTLFFSPEAERHTRDEPTLITVGETLRDFETLAAALQALWRRMPAVRLIAVGVTATAKRLLISAGAGRVTFLDGINDDELRSAYRSADAAVFALEAATANNAVLEAMACGLPIVATDVGGTREYLGADAVLCPDHDPEALAQALEQVLDDQRLAHDLSERIRARARRFDYAATAQEMARAYHSIALR